MTRRALAAGACAVLAATGLAGCGDADLKAAQTSAVSAATASSCAVPSARASVPDRWPDLPLLPDGIALTSVESRSGGRTVVGGVVGRPFKEVLATMRSTYKGAGLVLDHGEVEARDAESNFHGLGTKGRWALRQVDGCPSSTTVSLVVAPVS